MCAIDYDNKGINFWTVWLVTHIYTGIYQYTMYIYKVELDLL